MLLSAQYRTRRGDEQNHLKYDDVMMFCYVDYQDKNVYSNSLPLAATVNHLNSVESLPIRMTVKVGEHNYTYVESFSTICFSPYIDEIINELKDALI